MSLKFSVFDVPVPVTWVDLITFFPKKIHSILIYAEGALEIGNGGSGLPRASSESFALTWQDFDRTRLSYSDTMTIRAQAPAGAVNAVVVLITEE